jgi:hypothetical protein
VGAGGVTVVWIEIESWVISNGGTNGGTEREDELGNMCGTTGFGGPLYVFGCSSAVVVEGSCVRDCKGLRYVQLVQ